MKIFALLISSVLAVAPALAKPAKSVAPKTEVAFDAALGQLPESIAADVQGNLYVSMSNLVVKVRPDRQFDTLAELPVPAGVFATGVKFGDDGMLYVGSGALGPGVEDIFIWRISPVTGQADPFAELDPSGFPNDLAFDDDGSAYVTDSFLGLIWKIAPDGEATEWLESPALLGSPDAPALGVPFGADGIAFDRHKRNLYVTNLDFGIIYKVPVGSDGNPGAMEIFAADPLLVGADGIAFDRAGRLYVAVNAQDRVARVDRFGQVSIVAEGGVLDSPSGFAFGVQPCERNKLYISSFAVARANGLKPGQPMPAIVSMFVAPGGLPVP